MGNKMTIQPESATPWAWHAATDRHIFFLSSRPIMHRRPMTVKQIITTLKRQPAPVFI